MNTLSKCLIGLALSLPIGSVEIDVAKEAEIKETFYSSALINQSPVVAPKKEVLTVVTAYSSRQEETDSTPFLTASGSKVRSGLVAANWLPLGTKVKIPELFGDQIFIVEDRMHEKHGSKVDIWFPTTKEALNFGVKVTRIQVL